MFVLGDWLFDLVGSLFDCGCVWGGVYCCLLAVCLVGLQLDTCCLFYLASVGLELFV